MSNKSTYALLVQDGRGVLIAGLLVERGRPTVKTCSRYGESVGAWLKDTVEATKGSSKALTDALKDLGTHLSVEGPIEVTREVRAKIAQIGAAQRKREAAVTGQQYRLKAVSAHADFAAARLQARLGDIRYDPGTESLRGKTPCPCSGQRRGRARRFVGRLQAVAEVREEESGTRIPAAERVRFVKPRER